MPVSTAFDFFGMDFLGPMPGTEPVGTGGGAFSSNRMTGSTVNTAAGGRTNPSSPGDPGRETATPRGSAAAKAACEKNGGFWNTQTNTCTPFTGKDETGQGGGGGGCTNPTPKCFGPGQTPGDPKGGSSLAVCVAGQWTCPPGTSFPGGPGAPAPTPDPNMTCSTGQKWCPSVGACIPNSATCPDSSPGGPNGPNDNSGDPGPVIPQDLRQLRETLGRILTSAIQMNAPQIPGGVQAGTDPAFAQAISQIMSALGGVKGQLGGVRGAAQDVMNLSGYVGDTFEELSRTGGAPDITNALAAIRAQGMQDIDFLGAAERERYGEMGLGAGTDVATAVSRGQSVGVSDILARQESLIANTLSAANQTRLAAASGAASTSLQGAGLLAQIAELEGNFGLNAGQLLTQIGNTRQGVTERNLERTIADFIRTSQPWLMPEALAFATGFPPNSNPPIVGGGGSAWGALASMIPYVGSFVGPMINSWNNRNQGQVG